MKNNQNGRSMIEMLGVLAIIGVLSVSGFGMVKKMQNSYNTNKIMEEISGFTQKARILVREYTASDGDINAYLNSGKATPAGVIFDSGTSSFTGTAGVTYKFSAGTSPILFVFTISGETEDVCMQIAAADWGNSASNGFKGITIGTTTWTEPLSLGTAADNCENNKAISLSYR